MQNLINHVVFVLDASSSMRKIAADLVKVVDGQVARLARRSQQVDQETRVTIYTFADTAQWHVYEKDVLRLPSIKDLYKAIGNTALRDTGVRLGERGPVDGSHHRSRTREHGHERAMQRRDQLGRLELALVLLHLFVQLLAHQREIVSDVRRAPQDHQAADDRGRDDQHENRGAHTERIGQQRGPVAPTFAHPGIEKEVGDVEVRGLFVGHGCIVLGVSDLAGTRVTSGVPAGWELRTQ